MNSVKILSYNLNILPSFSLVLTGDHGYAKERAEEFLSRIHDYDILILQEIFSSPHLTFFCQQAKIIEEAKKLGFKHVFTGKQPSLVDLVKEQKWTDSGLVILSKFRFLDQGQLVFQDATHLDKGASKGALFVRVKVDRGSLLIFNCHLQAEHGMSKYNAIRTKQLRQFRKFIAKTSNKYPKDPWMIGGDFNIDAIIADDHRTVLYRKDEDQPFESDDYKIMLNIIDPSAEIKDLLKEKHGRHIATRPPREVINLLGIFRHKSIQRLDYLLWRPNSESLLEANIKKTHLEQFQVDNKPFNYISDHFGIVASVDYLGSLRSSAVFSDEEPEKKKEFNFIPPNLSERILAYNIHILVFIVIVFVYVNRPLNDELFLAILAHYFSHIPTHKYSKFGLKDVVIKNIVSNYSKKMATIPLEDPHPPILEEHEIDIYNNVLTHDTINQNFESICSEFSHRQCLGYRSKENGQLTPFEWICYEDLDRRVNNFGVGLRTTGLVTGDKVLIISENRPEWIICELACYSCGFITIPESNLDMLEKALADSNVKVAVVSWKHTMKILDMLEKSTRSYDLTTIIQIQEQPNTTTLAYSIVEKSERIKIQVIPFPYLENRGLGQKLPKHPAQPSDVVSYIYSHRSSGQIKCIPITHLNLVNMCKNLFKSHLLSDERRLTQNDVHLSSFPLARMYEKVVVMLYLLIGASIAFQHPDSRFFDDARQVRPSVLYCIPNDFTKLFAVYKLSLSSWSFRSQIAFDYIFKLKDICSNERYRDSYLKKRICDAVVKVVDFLIFSRISEQVGGKLRMIFVCSSGLAPASHIKFLSHIFCCKVEECFFRTETGIISSTRSRKNAGFPLCQIKIDSTHRMSTDSNARFGEILIRGKSVVGSYFSEQLVDNRKFVSQSDPGVKLYTGYISPFPSTKHLSISEVDDFRKSPRKGSKSALMESASLSSSPQPTKKVSPTPGSFTFGSPTASRPSQSPFNIDELNHYIQMSIFDRDQKDDEKDSTTTTTTTTTTATTTTATTTTATTTTTTVTTTTVTTTTVTTPTITTTSVNKNQNNIYNNHDHDNSFSERKSKHKRYHSTPSADTISINSITPTHNMYNSLYPTTVNSDTTNNFNHSAPVKTRASLSLSSSLNTRESVERLEIKKSEINSLPISASKRQSLLEEGSFEKPSTGLKNSAALRKSNSLLALQPKRFDDGWFHTFQIGQWNNDGTFVVLGHKSEAVYVKGTPLFPRQLELIYSESDFCQQIIVHASEDIEGLVAIVVPDYEVVYRWAKREKIKGLYSPENLYSSMELKKALLQDLHAIAKRHNLQDIKTITNIHIENCIIPEVLLLQRQLLHQKYEHVLEQLKSKSKPLPASHKPVRFATTLAPTRDNHEFLNAEDRKQLSSFRPTTRITFSISVYLLLLYLFWKFYPSTDRNSAIVGMET